MYIAIAYPLVKKRTDVCLRQYLGVEEGGYEDKFCSFCGGGPFWQFWQAEVNPGVHFCQSEFALQWQDAHRPTLVEVMDSGVEGEWLDAVVAHLGKGAVVGLVVILVAHSEHVKVLP